LLAHEIAHVAQQGQPGAVPGVQRDPRPAEGPGRSPPTEAFTEMPAGDTGAETGHVLFGRDDALLDAGDRDALDGLAAGAAPGTVVHVHGYASGEGDADYNRNLSAHRAVAVKAYLRSILPEGTRIIAYAYGETEAFGGRASNRRVGVDLVQPGGLFNPDFGARFGLHLLPPQSLRLGGGEAASGPVRPILPPPGLLEALAEGPPPPFVQASPLDSMLRLPPDLSLQPPAFDYSGIAGAFAERGLAYGSGEASSAASLYRELYRNYLWLGPDLAAQAAQFTVDSTVSANLSVQAPTRLELLDRQHQTEPTIVPVFNDTMLRWLIDRFGRDH
jgi:outer membrane protein OmpA-like peptidoglycan-associated protein